MYTYCYKSGVPIQCSETLSRFRIKIECVHPVFFLETERLLSLSIRQLTDEEVQLVFVALLDRTGLLEFRSPANPTVETCRTHIRKLAWIVDAIKVNEEKKSPVELSKLRISFSDSTIPNLTTILDSWEAALQANGLSQTNANINKPNKRISGILWNTRSTLSSAKAGLTLGIINWAEGYLSNHKDYDVPCISLMEHIKSNVSKRPAMVYKKLPTRLKSKMLFTKLRSLLSQSIDESENVINKKHTLLRFMDLLIREYTHEHALAFSLQTKEVPRQVGEFTYTVPEFDIDFKGTDLPEPIRTNYSSDLEFLMAKARYNKERFG